MSFPYLRLLAATAAISACFATAPAAHAAQPGSIVVASMDGVMVHEAWARATPGGTTTGAAYITVMGGSQADALLGASTPIAAQTMVHETINDNGVMKMREVASLPIPAGQTVTFKPGGNHIMLMGLKHPLKAGDKFPLTLKFAKAGDITVTVTVRAIGKDMPMQGGDHMKM